MSESKLINRLDKSIRYIEAHPDINNIKEIKQFMIIDRYRQNDKIYNFLEQNNIKKHSNKSDIPIVIDGVKYDVYVTKTMKFPVSLNNTKDVKIDRNFDVSSENVIIKNLDKTAQTLHINRLDDDKTTESEKTTESKVAQINWIPEIDNKKLEDAWNKASNNKYTDINPNIKSNLLQLLKTLFQQLITKNQIDFLPESEQMIELMRELIWTKDSHTSIVNSGLISNWEKDNPRDKPIDIPPSIIIEMFKESSFEYPTTMSNEKKNKIVVLIRNEFDSIIKQGSTHKVYPDSVVYKNDDRDDLEKMIDIIRRYNINRIAFKIEQILPGWITYINESAPVGQGISINFDDIIVFPDSSTQVEDDQNSTESIDSNIHEPGIRNINKLTGQWNKGSIQQEKEARRQRESDNASRVQRTKKISEDMKKYDSNQRKFTLV